MCHLGFIFVVCADCSCLLRSILRLFCISCSLPSVRPVGQRQNQHQHQRKQEAADCRGIREVVVLERFIVHPNRQRPRGGGGVTHQRHNEVKRAQGVHRQNRDAGTHRTLKLRNNELEVDARHIRAVQLRGVDDVDRNVLDGGKEDDRDVAGELPDHRNDDGQHDGGVARRPHQVSRFHRGRNVNAKNRKEGVQHAARWTIHVRPDRAGHDERQRERQQNQRAEQRRAAKPLIHDERQPQPQQEAQRNQAEQQQRIAQRRPEVGAGEHLRVVAEAAPAVACFQLPRLPVGHGNPQVPAQRDIHEVNQQRRRDADPNQRMPLEKVVYRADCFRRKAQQQLVHENHRDDDGAENPEPVMGKGHERQILKKFRKLFHGQIPFCCILFEVLLSALKKARTGLGNSAAPVRADTSFAVAQTPAVVIQRVFKVEGHIAFLIADRIHIPRELQGRLARGIVQPEERFRNRDAALRARIVRFQNRVRILVAPRQDVGTSARDDRHHRLAAGFRR